MARPSHKTTFFAVDGEAAQIAAAVFLGFHGLRTGLQDVEFAVQTVAAPFDVHWAAVVFFDGQRVMGQLGNFGVGNGESVDGLLQVHRCWLQILPASALSVKII